ncbi:response regulator [candidate division KSB1 bacterium]|jgi:CheY-like chemotaxis protein|nr:response regulator [candidate division KSB1 bacterium]
MAKQVILCVDDEKIILDSLKTQLKENFGNSYTYEVAENADDALEVIEELTIEGFDILIIVSDWLMPGIKGDEFLIKVHEKYPRIVKVMLTGQASKEAIERARQYANLHRYIAKPWSEQELVDAIKSGIAAL